MAKKVENHNDTECKAVFMMSFIKIESMKEHPEGSDCEAFLQRPCLVPLHMSAHEELLFSHSCVYPHLYVSSCCLSANLQLDTSQAPLNRDYELIFQETVEGRLAHQWIECEAWRSFSLLCLCMVVTVSAESLDPLLQMLFHRFIDF